jgi:hypothetical protein
VSWIWYYGSALIGLGHLLSPRFARLLFASGFSADMDAASSSHPDLDPLWSCERVQFLHDDTSIRRIDQVFFLAERPLALRHLRVCQHNRSELLNCGRCTKCLRTMVSLRLAGASDRATTFPPLDLDLLASTKVHLPKMRLFVEENLAAAEARGDDPELIRALRASLAIPPALRARLVGRRAYSVARRKLRNGLRRARRVLLGTTARRRHGRPEGGDK